MNLWRHQEVSDSNSNLTAVVQVLLNLLTNSFRNTVLGVSDQTRNRRRWPMSILFEHSQNDLRPSCKGDQNFSLHICVPDCNTKLSVASAKYYILFLRILGELLPIQISGFLQTLLIMLSQPIQHVNMYEDTLDY